MHNANALKIGLFGVNCSSGRSATKVPERWSASWEDCLALARMADDAGIDFLLPIGRWKGYGGDTDLHGETLETITWATGLLAETERITVFGTVHAPLFHPIIAAKQCVTADHIGEGRFGLNIVAGWNEGEFEMFGVQQREHEARYDYAQEWIDAIKTAWGPSEDFDFDGDHIKLKKVRAKPKPYGGTRPLIMNAGSSGTGQAFALTQLRRLLHRHLGRRARAPEATAKMVDGHQGRGARHRPRDRGVHGRPGDLPADAEGGRGLLPLRHHRDGRLGLGRPHAGDQEHHAGRRSATRNTRRSATYFASRAIGGYPFVGTPDRVAEEIANFSRAGVRGIAFSMVNYLDELPLFRDEVLPRLAKAGVRAGA